MIERPRNVRLATAADTDAIYEFSVNMQFENGLFHIDIPKAKRVVAACASGQGGLVGVIEDDGKIVGSVALLYSQQWYSDEWYLEELWNYIDPEYRKKMYILDLIHFSKWVSEHIKPGGMPLIMGILSNIRTEAKVRLYKRELPLVGGYFLYGRDLPNHMTTTRMDGDLKDG